MFTKKNRLIFMIIMVAVSAGAFIAGLMLLPDVLVVQVSSNGADSNTMPKLYGLLLPVFLTAGGAIVFYFDGEASSRKSLIISLVGVVVFVLTFVFNL